MSLMKITTKNLVLSVFCRVCWRFSRRTPNIFKIFKLKVRLKIFLKGKSYSEMRTLNPFCNFGFHSSCCSFLYSMDKQLEFLTFSGVKSIENFFVEFWAVTAVKLLESKIFNVTVEVTFKDRIVRSANATLVSHIVK